MKSVHRSVLLNEVIESLNLREGALVLDGTWGGGGHSLEICKRFPGARIIALDQDQSAFENSQEKFAGAKCDIRFLNENFRKLDQVLKKEGIEEVDGIIFDLGLSSDQLSNSGRGFSFMEDEPLLMTMKANPSSEDITAYDVVNAWGEDSLERILRGYGEEKFAKRIAHGVAESRKLRPIKTTRELVEIIGKSVPAAYRRGRIHFATRTFQAIRIAVNDELGALREGLAKGAEALKKEGRMAVITFHSLEDRIVKRFYKEKEKEKGKKAFRLINKKPIIASREEVKENPRSRSAKLRIIERVK